MTRSRLALLLGALALGLAGCGGEDDDTAAPPEPPSLTEQATTDGDDDEAAGEGDAEAGAEVYASAGCGGCHTLAAAGSSGTVGPNLDDADPRFDEAVEQITNGGDGMPAFKDQLTEEQIRDVAAYVTESAG